MMERLSSSEGGGREGTATATASAASTHDMRVLPDVLHSQIAHVAFRIAYQIAHAANRLVLSSWTGQVPYVVDDDVDDGD
jgi:hypothetical protein